MPPTITVRLEGDQKLRTGLNQWARSLAPITRERLRAAMQAAKKASVPHLGGASYAVPERGYERTGQLGFSTFLVEEGLSVRVVSEAYQNGQAYSEFVVGRADGTGQAGVHAGWWMTMRDAVDAEVEIMLTELDDELQASAESAGLG